MKVKITGRHLVVTPTIKKHIETQMDRLERYASKIDSVQVILQVEKFRHMAEIVLSFNHTIVQAKAATNEMHAAIDALFEKVATQVRRQQDKLNHHKVKRSPRLRQVDEPTVFEPDPVAIQTRSVSVYPLSVEAAIRELGEEAGAVLIFRNPTLKRTQVLRRLVDGSVEHLDPELKPAKR